MNNFSYTKAGTPGEAVSALAATEGAVILAGGTDLVPLMKEEIVNPSTLVDITTWEPRAGIESQGGGLLIHALTPLSALASNERVGRDYRALADACNLAATPQLRNMGTIGGNLLQQTRCWYYRGDQPCRLKGGEVCFARNGENEKHAIFLNAPGTSFCVSAHPSDPAPALLALNARVEGEAPGGPFDMALEELFALPTDERRSFTTLPANGVITGVLLPAPQPGSRSLYLKAMPRAAWAFALASVALYVEVEGDTVKEARIALGGVAPIPFRAHRVEHDLRGSRVSGLDYRELAEALTADASPLSQNGYKAPLLRGLFRRALLQLLG